jgi:choline kinase
MIGMVLAAGQGKRLANLTTALPKTLIAIDRTRCILDVVLGNLKAVGVEHIVIITGHRATCIEERVSGFEQRHGVHLQLIFNPKSGVWNNAYSLWCGRDAFGEGVLLVNGDTVHPPIVEERVLAAGPRELVLAVDRAKCLGKEEMKVQVSPQQSLEQITKDMDPALAYGEYMGIALIRPAAARRLTEALEQTWRRDPSLYYEDGFQEFVRRGGQVEIAPIGGAEWVEVDDYADLVRARGLACRC